MDILLKILGVILILIVFAVIAVIIIVKFWWRRLAAASAMPTEIKLMENPDPKWTRDHRVQTKFQAFADLGYEPTRVFLPTPQQIEMQFFANKDRKRHAVIYRTVMGFNEEFCADTVDGVSINVTNFEHAEKFTQKPRKVIFGMPGASIPELHKKFESLVANEELIVVPDDSIARHVEDQYKAGMTESYDTGEIPMWEDSFGDYSKRWADKGGGEVLREAFTDTVAQQLAVITGEVGEILAESESITAKQLSTYQYSLIICNPRIDRPGFGKYLTDHLYLEDDSDLKRINEITQAASDSQQIIEQVIIQFPQFKIVELSTIDKPFQATVYGFERPEELN